jgi:hypothetical protein
LRETKPVLSPGKVFDGASRFSLFTPKAFKIASYLFALLSLQDLKKWHVRLTNMGEGCIIYAEVKCTGQLKPFIKKDM